MSRQSISRPKKLLFSVLVFAAFFYGLDRAAKKVIQRFRIPVEGSDVLPGTVIQNSRNSFVDPDPTRIWVLRPGEKNSRRDILINSDGFRGEELRPEFAGRETLVMIGDSCVFGWGVGHGETIAVRLAGQLSEAGRDVEVINAGVPGYSSLQALNHLKAILESHDPSVVTVQLGWNDSWLTPGLNDREILASGARLISFNYFVRKLRIVRLSSYLISRRYYDKFKAVEATDEAKHRASTVEFRENLDAIVRLCREHDAVPILLTLPQRNPVEKPGIAEYLPSIHEAAAENKVAFIDLVPPIQSGLEDNEHLFVDKIHFSAEGSKAIAKIIAREVEENLALLEPRTPSSRTSPPTALTPRSSESHPRHRSASAATLASP